MMRSHENDRSIPTELKFQGWKLLAAQFFAEARPSSCKLHINYSLRTSYNKLFQDLVDAEWTTLLSCLFEHHPERGGKL